MNHPAKNKYGFWTNDKNVADPEAWLKGAKREEGSWWGHWNNWLAGFEEAEAVEPRQAGSEQYPVREAAPGGYVLQKLPIEVSNALIPKVEKAV
ncbi:polyhydroxyalkanoic acid synthase [Photobacterium aphoticum]|uniref:Polyhydroxyalkanoic acid synthase n=1 Tax=Photobacterium aphoticum TaxID=754436 RepID=A0A090R503_9GAMM|nr:polyhydroxyalkanoic acid synthase [Photobacterium aphoticum]